MDNKAFVIFSEVPARHPLRIAQPRVSPAPVAEPAPPPAPAIARLVLVPRTANAELPPELQKAMLETLASKPAAGETLDSAYRRIEHELGGLFARLSPVQARGLKSRLEQAREGDILATRFNRLVAERRLRLLAFLGDARRREALRGSGGPDV